MIFDTPSRNLLLTTARIVCDDGSGNTSSGTAFFYNAEKAPNTLPLLMTARHVVEGAKHIKIWILQSDSAGQPILGSSLEVDLPSWPSWSTHPNSDVDIAFLPVLQYIPSLRNDPPELALRMIGQDLLIPSDTLDDYDAVEDIVFTGYPNGLYDKVNYLPLTRRGTTASPIHLEWSGKPQFLVDASVFPGSSGSPVFALSEGSYRTKQALNVGTRIAFLGLISSVQIQFDETGELLTSSPMIRTRHMIDLGVVVRWTALEEAILSSGILQRP